tara:strand:+ start:761 stop:1354 length:594 start_codon:yes stop_codon:yes gene_type:complete
MIIFLDRQHAGQNRRRKSMGASRDLDGDGKQSIHETEAYFTALYGLACEVRLKELGYDVITISDGSYAERHKRCNAYQASGEDGIYIALHCNAGGGLYGAMFYDARSGNGPALAKAIASKVGALPELTGGCRAIAALPDGWTKNALYTIRGVRAVAICAEPAFIDTPAHRPLFTASGMKRIGEAMAEGIAQYIREKA